MATVVAAVVVGVAVEVVAVVEGVGDGWEAGGALAGLLALLGGEQVGHAAPCAHTVPHLRYVNRECSAQNRRLLCTP